MTLFAKPKIALRIFDAPRYVARVPLWFAPIALQPAVIAPPISGNARGLHATEAKRGFSDYIDRRREVARNSRGLRRVGVDESPADDRIDARGARVE